MSLKRVPAPLVMIALSAVLLVACKRTSTAVPPPSPSPFPAISTSPSPEVAATSNTATPPTAAAQAVVPSVGDPAPDFSLPTVWDETVSLEHYRGNTNVVLLFYRTGG